ncbi:hypothetical protein N799_07725 [Lysobacter arseniciresistens ZS79]|uniref:Histidine kinase/HSP90-like ATPase domain-containing protein n=1 Tax=Lysobacter arseniciresistens ZS79 TaxID=913325 RepID=A0A0A0F2I1_9GAMM|nr:hypothetical protein N799_07725 [Lysobacter arseniciresistens ZS79]
MPLTSSLLLMALVAAVAALAGAAVCYEVLCRRTVRNNTDTVGRQRVELQALTRRIITLQEDERSALSRELHDDIGQAITAIKLCALALDDEDDARRGATIAEISAIADQTVVKLRNLSLLLRPPQLDALGLEAALRWQAGTMFRSGTPELAMSLQPLPQRPAPAVELACFRIAQEALTNVLRHAGATRVELVLDAAVEEGTVSSSGDVDIAHHDDAAMAAGGGGGMHRGADVATGGDLVGVIELRVEDDGVGFDPRRSPGLGLVTMRERAEQLGGTLEVRRGEAGGTCVCARLPMAPHASREHSTTHLYH